MPNQKILAIDNLSLQEMDPDAELIPLMTPEDEEEMNNEALPEDIAILPLRNTVLFPGVVIPITAG
jgi:ATP-dependent Lon protease